MKKLLTILVILLFSLYYASADEALYSVRFYVNYSNFNNNLKTISRTIYNYLDIKDGKTKELNFNITNHILEPYSSKTYYIPPQEGRFQVGFYTTLSSSFVEITNPTYSCKIREILLKPNNYDLGSGNFAGRFNSQFIGNGEYKLFDVSYHLEIRPKEIICQVSKNSKLLYEDTICIRATKGFPKEIYKWRYSYKNTQGKSIEGTLIPYKIEDNGATIYVKGSDFLSESDFYDLVYSQQSITIAPDGTSDYNKPIYVSGVNITAIPSAPRIIDVKYDSALCSYGSAKDVTIYFNRHIAKGENLVLEFSKIDNLKEQITRQVTNQDGDKFVLPELYPDKWKVNFLQSRYIDKEGKETYSFSDGDLMDTIITITAPLPITINNISQTTTSCIGRADGTISCEVNGGTGEKTCSLYSSDAEFISHGTFQDGKFLFTGLSKGSYYLEATDENGCLSENSDIIEISEPEPLSIEVTSITDLECFGDSDGIVSYAASGGTGDIKCYLQNFAHVIKDSTYSNSFSKLSAGTYYLSATDENGCVTNKDTEFEISEPDSLWLELTTTDATIFGDCNGTLSASFGGGTDSYTIKYLENENTYSWPQENIELSKYLCAGESEVTLIDGNNCTTTKKYIINQPDPLTARVIQVDTIKCYGESTASLIVDSIKGGIPPYRVFWYNDNFSSEDYEIKDLSAEEYNLLVKDSAGASFELSTTIDQPKKIEIFSTDIKPVFCSGDSTGSISLIAEGGTLPYKFFLEDTLSTSGEYASLPAGIYTARVEDNNNCITEGLFTIETLSTLTAKISAGSPKCDYLNDGFIDLSVENGLEPYKITWYAEDKALKEDIFKMSELSAGDYSVIVQDAAGCVEKVDTTLYKPEEFNIELPEKLYLCIDQTYPITLESSRIDSVTWYLENQKIAKSTTEHLSKEGEYSLDIIYDKYCHEYKTIKVDTINKSVKANFLVAEEIPVHDDAHLINITSKEDYDYVEWVYPENDAWVYGEDEYSFQLVFLNEGTYQVGMISHKDKCEASLFKTIKTFAPKEGITIEENSYNITRFSIDKSPNNGTFTTHIELSAKADIILYLYNASTGHVIASEQDKNNKTYDIPFSVTTAAGEYILLLIVPEWEKSSWIKMLII